MSHAKLLMQRLQEGIDAGHYRSKGSPRPKAEAKNAEPSPAPAKREERREEPKKPESRKTDPKSYVQGLAARRREAVGASARKALDERFKEPKK